MVITRNDSKERTALQEYLAEEFKIMKDLDLESFFMESKYLNLIKKILSQRKYTLNFL